MAHFSITSRDGVHKGEGVEERSEGDIVVFSLKQRCRGHCTDAVSKMLETDYLLAVKAYLESLTHESRAHLHSLLVELKRNQEESLFALEREYLRLVSDRRFSTIAALKANCSNKAFVGEPLRALQKQNEEELAAFLRVRVFEGWQLGQIQSQKERLVREAGLDASLFDHQNYTLMRTMMQILWDGSK